MIAGSVLVTGGAGFIGSHAVLALCDAGRDVVVIDDLSTGVREAVVREAPFHQGNVGDLAFVDSVLARHRIESVMHFAGSISAPESVADPAKYYRNNTCASLALAQACLRRGVTRFVFSSTAAVYGACATSPVSEDAPARPLSPYGASKYMTEMMLKDLAAAQPGFRPVCLRYFNVAGADPRGRSGQAGAESIGLIRHAVEAALGQRPWLEIYGDDYDTRDGTGERDYIHVSDLAAAHLATLDYLERGGPPVTLNCGYGRGYTVLEVIAALESLLGREIPQCRTARRPGDPASAVSDVSRMRATLDWTPRFTNLETILETALAWHGQRAEVTS
ncbi:MAG TPA: UDP-glucose 4-epimerase GalE [Caulobacteraceae bacterium]